MVKMIWKAGIILDLDDTLYLEEDYVKSGFWSIANALTKEPAQAKVYGDWLIHAATDKRDGRTFNNFLEAFPDLKDVIDVPSLVRLYHDHIPNLVLPDIWREALETWRARQLFLGLISDGALIGQQRKVEALGLSRYFNHIILTDQYGQEYWKPHEKAFEEIQEVSGLQGKQLVYVGDNVLKDFIAPNRLGWHTIRLRISGQVRYALEPEVEQHAAHHEAKTYQELLNLLDDQLFALD